MKNKSAMEQCAIKELFLVILSFFLFSQTASSAQKWGFGLPLWSKTFGARGDDRAHAVVEADDGSLLVTGSTWSYGAGESDVYLARVSSSGSLLWEKTFGGKKDDRAYALTRMQDGSFAIAGETRSFGPPGWNVYFLKVSSSGKLLWQKAFGGASIDTAYAIAASKDGSLILAGSTRSFGAGGSDVYLLKVSSSGKLLWEKSFGGKNFDWADALIETKDGGLVVAGHTGGRNAFEGPHDIYLLKLTSSGELLWEKTFGGKMDDGARALIETKDGDLILAGETESFGAGERDVYLLKVSSSGELLWEKTYGGSDSDWAHAIVETKDGGLLVAGETESFGAGRDDVYLLKLSTSGDLLWEKTLGGGEEDRAFAIIEAKDRKLVIAGSTASFGGGGDDVYLLKIALEVPPMLSSGLYTVEYSAHLDAKKKTKITAKLRRVKGFSQVQKVRFYKLVQAFDRGQLIQKLLPVDITLSLNKKAARSICEANYEVCLDVDLKKEREENVQWMHVATTASKAPSPQLFTLNHSAHLDTKGKVKIIAKLTRVDQLSQIKQVRIYKLMDTFDKNTPIQKLLPVDITLSLNKKAALTICQESYEVCLNSGVAISNEEKRQ